MSGARYRWERLFMEHSGLPAPSRAVAWALASKTDPDLTIPAQFSPSLSTLAELAGMGRGTVAEHLNKLEAAGWVRRERPTTAAALSRNERTRYALLVPAGVVADDEQIPPSENRTSPGAGRGVVREPDGGSPGAGHNPALSSTSSRTSDADASGRSSRTDAPALDPEELFAAVVADLGGLNMREQRIAWALIEDGRPLPMIRNVIAAGRRPAEDCPAPEPVGVAVSRDGDPWAPPGPSMPGGGPW